MLEFLFGRRQAGDPWKEGWMPVGTGYGYGGQGYGPKSTAGGVDVSEESALTYSAVFCASRVLTETPAMLDLLTYRRISQEDQEQAFDFSLYDLLKYSPNPQMSSMPFREGRSLHQVNWGNGFAEIVRDRYDPMGEVQALYPIHPCRVKPPRRGDTYSDGRPVEDGAYLVQNNDGSRTVLQPWEMLHVPGLFSEDGIWGKGVIDYAREAVGFGLATEEHGASYFGSGGQPRGIVFAPGLKEREQRAQFRREWKEIHGTPDSSNIAILPVESKYQQVSMSNENSQYLQTRAFNVLEIARFYRIPPHMLMEMVKAGYASIEVMSLEFVIYSLLPWLRRWEEQCCLKLLTPAQRQEYYIEHNLAGLLRGDLKSRMEAYQTAIATGVMTINEARRLENLNNIGPSGDVHYVPMNMTTTERMMEGLDASQPKRGIGSDQSGTSALFAKMTRKLQATLGRRRKAPKVALPLPAAPVAQTALAMSPAELRDSARAVLQDVLRRMFTKESNAAARAMKTSGFEEWLEEFYGKHLELLHEALPPCCGVLRAAGVNCHSAPLAQKLIAESRAELLAAYDSETPTQMAARLAGWPTSRVESVTLRILEGDFNVQ